MKLAGDPVVREVCEPVAFTPKGGCPLKLSGVIAVAPERGMVAFTPKGGCPLKHHRFLL